VTPASFSPARSAPDAETTRSMSPSADQVRRAGTFNIEVIRPPAAAEAEKPPHPAFTLRNVGYTYARGVRALHDVNATIPAGRHTVVLGPSGSGKTTLLGCLAGRLVPTDGRIEHAGRIATIYQDLRLVPERSVVQNVLDGALGRVGLVRSVLGMPKAERAFAHDLIRRVGLSERADHPVSQLSGGERQRVAIARALMQRPGTVLADEPVCSLDRANAHAIMRLFREVCAEHQATLITVLHDEELARCYADERLQLEHGQIVCALPLPAQPVHDPVLPGQPLRLPVMGRRDCPTCEVSEQAPPRCTASRTAEPIAVIPARPAWMHPVTLLVLAIAAIALYAWSFTSLGLAETGGRSAVEGLRSFFGALIPTSLDQLTSIPWKRLGGSLLETLQMSLIGTTAGIALALPAAALAARNTGPAPVRAVTRQALNAIRTIPALIWALLFVAAVGFGPLAGVLALTFYSVGYLSKFFYESFENVPRGAQDALREIGASGPQRFLRAVAPASRPALLASSLFMLEYNVRSASVLGIVDAGGIGTYIRFYLEMRNFPAAVICLVLIFLVVVGLDALSVRLRRRLVTE